MRSTHAEMLWKVAILKVYKNSTKATIMEYFYGNV